MTHVWFHVCLGYLLPNVFVNLFHIQVIRVYHYDFDRLSQELSNAGCDVINPGYDIFLVLGQKCARLGTTAASTAVGGAEMAALSLPPTSRGRFADVCRVVLD